MVISDEILEAAQVTEAEIRAEIALALFARERLTLGQAARVADLPQLDFQALLATRKIAIHYGIAELEEDLSVFGDRDDALPSFHDDYLVGYKVDCKARVIRLHIMAATLEQGTISTVTLAGVEGYRFENDAFGNIILSLEAVTLTQFISDFGSEIRESHRLSGAPGPWAASLEPGQQYLREKEIQAFVLSSSYGMSGWVLAKRVSVTTGY
jgi:predicted HTH domain antitoxin